MQSLALAIQVMSEEGGALEVGEEEDDLLRAAEELGIDLSARYRAEERAAAQLHGDMVPTEATQFDEEADDEPEETDEFEGAPEIATFETPTPQTADPFDELRQRGAWPEPDVDDTEPEDYGGSAGDVMEESLDDH
jgi:hypothetical protein